MRLRLVTFVSLGLAAFSSLASSRQSEQSNLTLYGAPRHNLDGVLPVLSIEEQYIRAQTDGIPDKASGAAVALQCSAASPCYDGSCCNSQGQCGYRGEHCKKSCVANCDSKAPCGVDSKDGSQSCPLNVCCAHFGFCGASEFFCRDSTASGESTPCQSGFGKCGTVSTKASPTCGKGSGTASRKVAYYEGWNTRVRPCDKVWPADIDTTDLTQLIFSFAMIDPKTFAVGPMHPEDEKLYIEFLGLQDGSQKWIGIGGWEFSDAGATRHTWSQMAKTKANREAFISSLLAFLEKWKFTGVDIDWEWPGAESRGGNPTIDKQNQVVLMQELRAALDSHGLSVVLPAQYEYLKNLDPKALEGSVDAFNVLAYDLHGPWDAFIPGLGPFAKAHTDLDEIDAALELLWFTNVTPSKVNLGIANYGRGYTLADDNCAHLNCTWTGPSKAGDCTQLAGILSQCEIKRAISENNLKPQLIESAGIKQIVFDGQWFGYDDSETIGFKIELANSRCLGGTALWAIDYASCTGGGPVGPGLPQHSSAPPSPSAPGVSITPPSASGIVPSVPSSDSPPTASSTFSAPAASSAPAPSTPAASLRPAPAPQSSFAPSASPPAQSSAAASSVSVITPSATSWVESSAAPTTVAPTAPPSRAESSAATSTTSAAQQTTSKSLIISSSQDASSGGPPIVIMPTSGFSRSSAVTTFSASDSGSSLLSSAAASQVISTPSSSPGSVASSSASWSSTPLSWTSPSSSSSSAGRTISQSFSGSVASSLAPESPTPLSWTSPSSSSLSASRAVSQTSPAASLSSLSTMVTSGTAGASFVTSSADLGSSGAGTTSSMATTRTTLPPESSSTAASFSSRSSSEHLSFGTSSAAQSSQTPSDTTSFSRSKSRFSTASGVASHSGSQSSVATSGAGFSSPPSSFVVSSNASSATSWPVSSSVSESSEVLSRTSDSLARSQSMMPVISQSSVSSLWSSTAASSGVTSSETERSDTLTHSGPGSTLNQGHTSYTTEDSTSTVTRSSISATTVGTTSVGLAQPITMPADTMSTPLPAQPTSVLSSLCSKCLKEDWCEPYANTMVSELPEFPPSECLEKGNEWCVDCWPKLSTYKPEMCPSQCWLLDWCKPLCTTPVDKIPDTIPPPGIDLPWFTAWWWNLPVPECVPNDCKAECHEWFGLSLALFKQPFCPCVPRTCTKGEKKENKDKRKCQLLGCGCGFMGLNIICDVKIKIDWKLLFPSGIFGPEPCLWFGGCLPKPGPGPPPPPPPPGGGKKEWGDKGCGPLGCKGYCHGKGCAPCPSELCKGPECTRIDGCGPRTGPDPTPAPTPKPGEPDECEEKDKTTVTEQIVSCFNDLKLRPTTIASINYTQTETLRSACITFEATISGCGVLGTSTTTTLTSLTTTSSEAPRCTRAPLDLNNDEGDNPQPPRSTATPEGPTCSRAPLSLDDDEGDNDHPEPQGPSCTRAPLSLDDDEGDNSQPTSSEAPACTRAPLSLDDDEGNNEMPDEVWSSISRMISRNSSMPMTSTFANFSATISRELPPSTLSMSTAVPWITGIPTGVPSPQCDECDKHFNDCLKMRCPDGSDAVECAKFCLTAVCYDNDSPDYCKYGSCRPAACPKDPPRTYETAEPALGFTTIMSLPSTTLTVTAFPTSGFVPKCTTCDLVFAECTKNACKQDGSDAERCAKRCLADLCYGDHKADLCKRGFCRPAACPNNAPHDYGTAEPAMPFTTVLSFPSTTLTVSATPTYTDPTLTHSPTPRCDSGHPILPNGKWTVLIEHKIQERPDNATFKWDLWDEHGCPAGSGTSWNQYLGYKISAEIGAFGRPEDQKMGYTLHTSVTESLSTAESEIHFQISKPVADCEGMCHTEWKVNKRELNESWQISNDCAQQCGSKKLTSNDVNCETGINKWQGDGDNPTSIRGGYCTFSMPFKTANDDPPTSWTRDSRWTLDIVQTMEYERSSVEWWAKDPNGINATHELWDTTKSQRGPLVSEYVAGGVVKLPGANYDMYLLIRSPRTKDNSTIELTYLSQPWPETFPCDIYTGVQKAYATAMCQPSYRTETNDEKSQSLLDDCTEGQNFHCCHDSVMNRSPPMSARHTYCKTSVFKNDLEFSCDKVAHAFYPKNAGFERRFRCWWPQDFVDKYQHMERDLVTGSRLMPEYLRYQTRRWPVEANSAGSGLADVPGPNMAPGGFNGTVGAFSVGGGENVSWTNGMGP